MLRCDVRYFAPRTWTTILSASMSFTRICTPAFGTLTLYQLGWYRPT